MARVRCLAPWVERNLSRLLQPSRARSTRVYVNSHSKLTLGAPSPQMLTYMLRSRPEFIIRTAATAPFRRIWHRKGQGEASRRRFSRRVTTARLPSIARRRSSTRGNRAPACGTHHLAARIFPTRTQKSDWRADEIDDAHHTSHDQARGAWRTDGRCLLASRRGLAVHRVPSF